DPDPALVHTACAALDGRDPALLQWITDSRPAALIADNYAAEHAGGPKTAGARARRPLPEHCPPTLGVPPGATWYLPALAQWLRGHKRNRFLLTAPPLRLPGAVGSPVSPIATV